MLEGLLDNRRIRNTACVIARVSDVHVMILLDLCIMASIHNVWLLYSRVDSLIWILILVA